MKILIAIAISLFVSSSPVWVNDMQQARQEASQQHKYILLNFSGSDWCIPCIRMHKEVFESGAFETLAAEKLVLVQADFPRLKKNQPSKEQVKKNEAMADQYNPEGKFPFTVLLDENGKVLKQWDGYSTTADQFVKELNQLVHAH